MSMILRIKEVKKDRHVETGEGFLDVTLQIIDPNYIPDKIKNEAGEIVANEEGKALPQVIDIRKLSFPMDKNKDDIKKDLKAYIDMYNAELESAKVREVQDKVDQEADKTIEELTGGILK